MTKHRKCKGGSAQSAMEDRNLIEVMNIKYILLHFFKSG